MGTDREGIELVKLTKEEQEKQREELRKAKREAYERIPEKDREKKKKYQKQIIKTTLLFVAALAVLGLLASGTVPSTAGILGLVIISALSMYISRRDK